MFARLERFIPQPLLKHKPFFQDFMKEFKDDDINGLACELSYRFFIALFPLLLVIVTLGGVIARWAGVDDPSAEVLDIIGDSLPDDAASLISNQAEQVVNSADLRILSIGLFAAVWASAGGAGALMKATNRVYDLPETRPMPVKLGIAMGVTLFGGLGLLIAVSVMIATQTLASELADSVGLGKHFGWVVQIVRLPLIVFFVAIAAQAVYWIAPNRKVRIQLTSPGAWVFALGWGIFTVGFAFYVTHFSSYNATYGAIAGVVVMLLWLQVTSLLILVGAELNGVLEKRAHMEAARNLPQPQPYAAPRVSRPRPKPAVEFTVLAGTALAAFAVLRKRPREDEDPPPKAQPQEKTA